MYGPGVGGPALPAGASGGDPVVSRVTAPVVTAQHVHVGTQALQGPVSRQHSLTNTLLEMRREGGVEKESGLTPYFKNKSGSPADYFQTCSL